MNKLARVLIFVRWWIVVYCTLWLIADGAITVYYDVLLSPWTLPAILLLVLGVPKEVT